MSLTQSAYENFSGTKQPKQSIDLQVSDFTHWSSSQQYRTMYRNMSSNSPGNAKRCALPGYSGYIPSAVSDNAYGKTFTRATKEQLNREKFLPDRTTEIFPRRPCTTQYIGLGKFGGGIPDEYHSVSRLHGKSTIPAPHPNHSDSKWQTSYAASWNKQHLQRNLLNRNTHNSNYERVSNRPITQASGFSANNTLLDGQSPIKHINIDMRKTEYRSKFNPAVPFHPRSLGINTRSLKKNYGCDN